MEIVNCRSILKGFVVATTTLTLVGCSQDLETDGQPRKEQAITFLTSVADNLEVTRAALSNDCKPIELTGDGQQLWLLPTVEQTASSPFWGDKRGATRGTQLTPDSVMASFGVSAFKHDAQDTDLSDNQPDFFYNLEATKTGTAGVYQVSEPYYWPQTGERLTFNAYYPYGSQYVTLTDAAIDNKNMGPQRFTVQVAPSAKDQVDFMTATTGESPDGTIHESASPNVALTFNHHMTAVKFVLGNQFLAGYIKSITISGIYGQGTYAIGSGWTVSETDKTNVTISYVQQTKIDKQVDGTAGQSITSKEETFLLIPQTFTANDNAKITILYNDGYDDYEVTASLAGQQSWLEGTTVTYAISSEYLTTLRISDITFPTTVSGAPKTNWANGDKVGMYVVKPDGTTIEYENVPCTYVGGTGNWKWNITHPTGKTIYKLPGYSYYFYYPYRQGGPSGYPVNGHSAGEPATEFFSGVISSYATVADQSDVTKFADADLQVAKATDDVRASTIKAAMTRQVGLARFRFATAKTIPQNVTYNSKNVSFSNNTYPTPNSSSGSSTIAPSTNFQGNKPYLSGGTYYFWTKAGQSTTFNSNPSDANHWKEAVNINLAAGAYTADADIVTVQDHRYNWICTGTATFNYDYNTSKQPYTLSIGDIGTFTMRCWGASGGGALTDGKLVANDISLGGYTYGELTLTTAQDFYIYVGQHGTDGVLSTDSPGGWNGGGVGSWDTTDNETAGGGGGATDIRLENGAWDDFASLKSRIMVAGGGGGATYYLGARTVKGGYGGGLSGADAALSTTKGGTQTSGYKFGIGQNGKGVGGPTSGNNVGAGGGGGGYWGGQADQGTGISYDWKAPYYYGGGGSSFVSGLTGCVAIDESSTEDNIIESKATDNTVHYSGLKFTNASTIDGNSSMPKTDLSGNETGHAGNGYCRIVLTH